MNYALGIDLGGSSVKAIAVTPNGETLWRSNVAFNPDQPMDWAEKISVLTATIIRRQSRPPMRIGVCAPGLAAADERSIAHMPGRLPGLNGFDWTKFLKSRRPVPVLNDAHAALLGEAWLGAARGFDNVIMLTLGTGVGGAAMVDGRLLRGRLGRAGHLGHVSLSDSSEADVCGTPGSLEVAIGNCTIQTRSRGRFRTTHELIEAYRAGDRRAATIWLRSVRDLARGICSFVNVLDPEAVVIGGGIARAGRVLFEPLQRELDTMEWRPLGAAVRLVRARLGEMAGAYGAARRALLSPAEAQSSKLKAQEKHQ